MTIRANQNESGYTVNEVEFQSISTENDVFNQTKPS